VTPVNIKENAMDRFIGVRQSLEIVPPPDFRDSSDTMPFTDDRVRAVETPLTERWFQDALHQDLLLQVSTTGAGIYWRGPSQQDGRSILTFIGSTLDYTVEHARTKARWLAEGIPLGTIQRTFRSSMHTKYVVLEYVQETDPDCPHLLLVFFDHFLVPDYGHSWLTRIDTERWLSLIKDASKDQPITSKFLHRNIKDFLGWAARKQLLRRNPLSGTSKPPPLAGSDEADLFQVLETPTATNSTAKSLDSIPPNDASAHEISQESQPETTPETHSSASA
jgi:hypothetical protein